ncbi:ATP-binding cassette domain-containing protein [Alkaliphilus pronyensis]|uniref:ATP-binding cassette domain-containing protein n=1 Tax=Alkaliphilus pronyensis TaxID=1482732 RepID=A0A6I0F8I8_9FIRM|nr:ATP-binding cassette domain-containing protein [Alkaliphilus pronyensis]KAB3534824.1 ATP-binding cassette domain-containing protein [Alkaliphilus pronyensis]
MKNNVIKVSGLNKDFKISKNYDSFFKRIFSNSSETISAISDFNFTVETGEILGILGKNGAGKTSLIKMLTGILTPTSGEIEVIGYCPQKNRYKYTFSIGVVLGQKSLLWYNIPVIESLKLYKSIYGIDDEKFNKRLALFERGFAIKKLLDVPVRKLSLGERMKCEIVASLLHDPTVLFLDEPTIGLDVISKEQIHKFLKRMNKELDTTIIITTHNLDDIEKLCNRVLLIDHGKKIFDGAKDHLLSLDDKKTIIVKGKLNISPSVSQYLVNENQNVYKFQCSKDNINIIGEILKDSPEISDIEIYNNNLEMIISKIYKGEIVLNDCPN